MAQSPAPSDPATDPGDSKLLSTKLHVPHVPPAFVGRDLLVDRLEEGCARAVTLVCAPPGFGKSVLVAEWCRRNRRPIAWLSLDEGDNDPVRFWRHVAAALDRALGDSNATIVGVVEALVRGGNTGSFDAVATVVINVLSAVDEVVLVLDDFHAVDDEAVQGSVGFLLEHAPPGLHVVLVSRADPRLPLSRWRARGELMELRAHDLRFGLSEASEFLRNATGSDIPRDAVATLVSRTEGWVAGLQLVGLTLDRDTDVSAFVEQFSGSHRFVVDYLTEEVLDRQSSEVREFLLHTSVLERLSGPLCDAVTGRTDSQALLESIEQANLFLLPLDDVREWWRYHHLFADLLRVRLRHESSDTARELHRRAAGWHESHKLIHDAVRHALAAGDPTRAASVIERHADELLLSREGATLQRLAAELPAGLRGSQRLCLAQARIAIYAGRVLEAETLLEQAERSPQPAAAEPFVPSLGRAVSPLADVRVVATLLRAFVAHLRGDADGAEALAASALETVDDEDSTLALIARWHLAVAPWLRGSVAEAAPDLAVNIDRWKAIGQHDRAAWGVHYLGKMQLEQGRPDVALETYREVLGRDAAQTGSDAPTAGIAHVGIAEVAYLRGDLAAARHHGDEGIALCRDFVYSQALATGLSTRARVFQAEGDPVAARDAIAEAIEVGPDAEVADLLDPVPVRRAQLLLAQGDVRPAAEWVALRGLGVEDVPRHAFLPAYLLLARLLVAQGRPHEAIGVLGRLSDAASADGRLGDLVETEALRALALADLGDAAGALEVLAAATVLGDRQEAVRIFVDEGAPMAMLIGQLVESQPDTELGVEVPFGFLGKLVRLFDEGASPGAATREGLVVGLTDREIEVLREVAAGKKNTEIAASLFVSLNTVKKHMTHIFEKLGVDNRTAAVARARELELLT